MTEHDFLELQQRSQRVALGTHHFDIITLGGTSTKPYIVLPSTKIFLGFRSLMDLQIAQHEVMYTIKELDGDWPG